LSEFPFTCPGCGTGGYTVTNDASQGVLPVDVYAIYHDGSEGRALFSCTVCEREFVPQAEFLLALSLRGSEDWPAPRDRGAAQRAAEAHETAESLDDLARACCDPVAADRVRGVAALCRARAYQLEDAA
jgi:hypothetical protein